MSGVALKCPHCGQRVRATWARCPACRGLIQYRPVEVAVPATSDGPPAWLWPALSGLALAVVAGVWMAQSPAQAEDAATASPAAGAAIARPPVPPSATQPAPEWAAVEADRAGTTAYRAGDIAGALAQYDEAVRSNAADVTARANLAQVLVRLGRTTEALPHLDYVVEQKPAEWAPRFNRGRAYAQLSRWDEARRDYEAAAAIFPDDHVTLFNLGLVHRKAGDHAAAAAAFERVVALSPDDPSFLVTLGAEYQALNRHEDMRRVFERYLEVAPSGPDVENVKKALAAAAAR
jgi:tetratricopeptide (TPR) repeat protein